ncbi:MAG: glycosyltransferase family 2 protein [Ruminiclostridium sp.]
MNIKISIITASYNSEKYIKNTIQSVLAQTYKNIEYLIIDANSKDTTLDIVQSYKENISKIICEPDKGLYDAWNKGIELATGDYIFFLNSDDVFFDEFSIYNFVQCINKNNKPAAVYAQLLAYESNSSYTYIDGRKTKLEDFLRKMYFCTPTAIIRKDVYKKIGKYSLEYKISSDYDWAIRLFKTYREEEVIFLDQTVLKFRLDGMSNTNEALAYSEINKIVKVNFSKIDYLNHYVYVKKLFLKKRLIPILKKIGLLDVLRNWRRENG